MFVYWILFSLTLGFLNPSQELCKLSESWRLSDLSSGFFFHAYSFLADSYFCSAPYAYLTPTVDSVGSFTNKKCIRLILQRMLIWAFRTIGDLTIYDIKLMS